MWKKDTQAFNLDVNIRRLKYVGWIYKTGARIDYELSKSLEVFERYSGSMIVPTTVDEQWRTIYNQELIEQYYWYGNTYNGGQYLIRNWQSNIIDMIILTM